MDTFDNLHTMLVKVFGYNYSMSRSSDGSSLNVTIYDALSKIGEDGSKCITLSEKQAQDLYEILSKGSLVKSILSIENFQVCVSEQDPDIVSFLIDGKFVSRNELDLLYKKAKTELEEKMSAIYDEVEKIKLEFSKLVGTYKFNALSIADNNDRLRRILSSQNVREEIKELYFKRSIPESKNQDNVDIAGVISEVKENMDPNKDNKILLEIVNKISSGEYSIFFLNEPCFLDWHTIKGTNDIAIFYDFLKVFKEKLLEAKSQMKKAINDQEKELESIRETINSIKTLPFLDKSKAEAVKEIIDSNGLDIDKNIDLPHIESETMSDSNKRFSEDIKIPSIGYNADSILPIVNQVGEQQNVLITKDEKVALNLYKTQLYRAFNEVIRYQKQRGLPLDQIIINDDTEAIIKSAYDEMEKQYKIEKSSPMYKLKSAKSGSNESIVESIFEKFNDRMPTYEQYRELVIKYYNPLMSSLSKVTLTADLTVYRGVSGNDLNLTGVISTTLDPTEAEKIGGRTDDNKQVFIRMILPKGSPVIIYTDDLLKDSRVYQEGFSEEQKEVAFNSELFDVISAKESSIETKYDDNGKLITVLYYDVVLKPKTQVYNKEESGTQRS